MSHSLRALFAVTALALVTAACGSTPTNPDVVQPFDSGGTRDIVAVDNGVPPADTNTMCDFVPTTGAEFCRVLNATCTTGPITCDGGMSFANSTCRCASGRQMMQFWQCDNYCTPPGTDAGAD